MNKISKLFVCVLFVCTFVLGAVSCSSKCNHNWIEATCTTPRTCSLCSAVRGEPLGHSGGRATCKGKAICEHCGEEYGEKPDHTWVDVTTATGHINHCGTCDLDIGEEVPHDMQDGSCSVCGFTPTIALSSATASAGEEVELTISLSDNSGIAGLQITVKFAPTVFELLSVENGTALTDFVFTSPNTLTNGSVFLWDGLATCVENGDLLTLKFKVGSDIAVGNYPIEIEVIAYIFEDGQFKPVEFTIINGSINV